VKIIRAPRGSKRHIESLHHGVSSQRSLSRISLARSESIAILCSCGHRVRVPLVISPDVVPSVRVFHVMDL